MERRLTEEKGSTARKTFSNANLSTKNLTWTLRGKNPDFRRETSAPYRLIYI
jgi:hypothetical protein